MVSIRALNHCQVLDPGAVTKFHVLIADAVGVITAGFQRKT
jgi:hypothetical protein